VSERVLATDDALRAAKEIHALLSGRLPADIRSVSQYGRVLANPGRWDGPQASRFRSEWPTLDRGLNQVIPMLDRLHGDAQKVIQDILRAGSGDLPSHRPPASQSGGGGGWLGWVHVGLAIASFIPVVGSAAALADAGIYAAQGDYVDAGLSALGAIPMVGEAADAVKAGRLAVEGVEDGAKLIKAGDEALQVARATEDGAHVAGDGADAVHWMGKADDFLANGAEVEHGPTFTRIGSDQVSINVAEHAPPDPGKFDVVVHGNGPDFVTDGMPTNPAQIADAVRGNPNYTGQPIRLLSCYSANGAAQELADELGVEVIAPTSRIGTPTNPPFSVILDQGGTWQTFKPTPPP
jgi:hypothetical protein